MNDDLFFKHKDDAEKLSHYLTQIKIDNTIEAKDHGYIIIIQHEEQKGQATRYAKEYKQNPGDKQFNPSANTERPRIDKTYFKRSYQYPITIIILSIAITIFTLTLTDLRYAVISALLSTPPGSYLLMTWQQPWRIITPIFLHFGFIHIIFNCFWLYDLGKLIESHEKRWFYVLLVLSAAILGNLMQLYIIGPNFGGLSGVVYGLFGYLFVSSQFNPWSGYYLRKDIIFWMMGWFVLCFTGYLGPVANFGHLGGLIAGATLAWLKKYTK